MTNYEITSTLADLGFKLFECFGSLFITIGTKTWLLVNSEDEYMHVLMEFRFPDDLGNQKSVRCVIQALPVVQDGKSVETTDMLFNEVESFTMVCRLEPFEIAELIDTCYPGASGLCDIADEEFNIIKFDMVENTRHESMQNTNGSDAIKTGSNQ